MEYVPLDFSIFLYWSDHDELFHLRLTQWREGAKVDSWDESGIDERELIELAVKRWENVSSMFADVPIARPKETVRTKFRKLRLPGF